MIYPLCLLTVAPAALATAARPHTVEGNIEGFLDNAGEIIGLYVNIFHFSFT